jgi:hypothetical protein
VDRNFVNREKKLVILKLRSSSRGELDIYYIYARLEDVQVTLHLFDRDVEVGLHYNVAVHQIKNATTR